MLYFNTNVGATLYTEYAYQLSSCLDEETVIVGGGAEAPEERSDARDLAGRLKSRRKFRVQIEGIPVHL